MAIFRIPTFVILTILSVAVQNVLAAPEPVVTAAAVLPRKRSELEKRQEESFRAAAALQYLSRRASKPGMNVCYGMGSICDLYLDMDCPISLEGDDWYKCMCETGYISAKAACQNCDTFYDLGGTNDGDKWFKECSSRDLSIAPIPTQIVSAWSEFNATVTFPSGSGAPTGGSGSSKTSDSSESSTTGSPGEGSALDLTASETSTSTSRASGARTYGDYTVTMVGMPETSLPSITTTGLPPLALGGSSGGTSGSNGREIVWLSVAGATAFSIICGIVLVL